MSIVASVTVVATESDGTESRVNEDLSDRSDSDLSGEANNEGASTDKRETDDDGNTTETNKTKKTKDSSKFKKAAVTISLWCANVEPGQPTSFTLKGEGNVSATAKLSGGGKCIEVVTVNENTDPQGMITTVTKTQKKCCP